MKLHTGDTVLVISGKDKGKTGTILRVMSDENRVVVGSVNIRTRHIKKTFQQAGRILKYEAALSASNVMILDPKTGKPARIGYKIDEKGKKIRISKISGDEVKAVKPKKEVKKGIEGKKGIKGEKDDKGETVENRKEVTPDGKEVTVPVAKKAPFWKRMGLGASMEGADNKEPTHMQEDRTIPDQQIHVRKGGRGT